MVRFHNNKKKGIRVLAIVVSFKKQDKKSILAGVVMRRDFVVDGFIYAYVTIALEAKKINHHPEWSNVYNTVNVKLSTHDAGGVTDYDIKLANIIDHIKASKVKYQRGIQK